jgi:hypothetical protein
MDKKQPRNGHARLQINIPKPDLRMLRIPILGVTEYISHRMSEESINKIEAKQQGKAEEAKKPRDPKAETLAALYLTDNGVPGIPAAAFKKAVEQVASLVIQQDQKAAKTVKGAIQVLGDIIPIKGKWRHRNDMGRLQGRTASPIYRPGFPKWEVSLDVQYNAGLLSAEQVLNLFVQAGFLIGVGDWRPQKSGNHGMFTVKP